MLESAVNEKIGVAIEKALGSWDVSEAIRNQVSESIATGVIRESLDRALENLDTERLVASLAEQIERTATKATVAILRDGFVETIAKLRGIESYDSERKQKLAEIRAELDLG